MGFVIHTPAGVGSLQSRFLKFSLSPLVDLRPPYEIQIHQGNGAKGIWKYNELEIRL